MPQKFCESFLGLLRFHKRGARNGRQHDEKPLHIQIIFSPDFTRMYLKFGVIELVVLNEYLSKTAMPESAAGKPISENRPKK